MLSSMTGFARLETQKTWGTLICELRSVNHRYLEPSLRVPEIMRVMETELREKLRKGLSRGKVEVMLSLKAEGASDSSLALNELLASQIIDMATQVQGKLSNPAPQSAMDVLRWPGVIKTAEIDAEVLKQETLTLFTAALEQLKENRRREGLELKSIVEQKLAQIAEHVKYVRGVLPQIVDQYTEKLRSRLNALELDVDEQRFNQELVYVAQKSDVAEELDRLEAHLNEVKHTLEQKGPIGRRLDFLMQELNREANTLSSKSMSAETSQTAVELKVLIEQIREQVQNIE